jgi:transcriptional regulator with XRE-family HTH domain
MISLLNITQALKLTRENIRARRVSSGLTQEGLANRSGVPLPTLRKFEQTGLISLESFFKLLLILDGLDTVIAATKVPSSTFSSIDEVLQAEQLKKQRKNGWIK